MRRRDVLAGLLLTAATRSVQAQQADRIHGIAMLMGIEDDLEGESRIASFQQALKDLGWMDGRDIRIDVRWAAGDPDRASAYAAELVGLAPSVIIGNGAPAVQALREATSTVPIVFVQLSDPVGQGLVSSLARPGGNITGFLTFEPNMGGKWLEVLKEVAPALSRVALVFSPATAVHGSGGGVYLPLIKAAAMAFKVESIPTPVRDVTEIESVIEEFARMPGGGLIVLPDTFNTVHRDVITALAARYRLPAVYAYRYFVMSGGLISYGIDTADLYRRAASYVDRILKGTKPAELPVQVPVKSELVINLKTANALGLTIPPSLLALADEVIE